MTFNEENNNPKIQLAKKEGELEVLKNKKDTLKSNIGLVPVKNAQILFYAGLAVSATIYGTIVLVGPIMVIAGIIYWVKSSKKRTQLQEDLSKLDEEIGNAQIEVNILRAAL